MASLDQPTESCPASTASATSTTRPAPNPAGRRLRRQQRRHGRDREAGNGVTGDDQCPHELHRQTAPHRPGILSELPQSVHAKDQRQKTHHPERPRHLHPERSRCSSLCTAPARTHAGCTLTAVGSMRLAERTTRGAPAAVRVPDGYVGVPDGRGSGVPVGTSGWLSAWPSRAVVLGWLSGTRTWVTMRVAIGGGAGASAAQPGSGHHRRRGLRVVPGSGRAAGRRWR